MNVFFNTVANVDVYDRNGMYKWSDLEINVEWDVTLHRLGSSERHFDGL